MYLESGKYFWDFNTNWVCKKDSSSINYLEKIFLRNNSHRGSKHVLKIMIKKIIKPKDFIIRNEKNNIDFKGTLCFFSNVWGSKENLKFFDFTNNLVLTKFNQQCIFKKTVEDYKFYSIYFNIPRFIHYNEKEKIIIEEHINSIPRDTWDITIYDDIIKNVFNYYSDYYQKYTERKPLNSIRIKDLLDYLENNKITRKFALKVLNNIHKKLLYIKIPILPQHGDLSFHNIILNEDKEIYFIDWDRSGEYIAFFDLFNLLQSWSADIADNFPIKIFFNGKYDVFFRQIFKTLNYEFKENNKADYLLISLVQNLYIETQNNNSEEYQRMLTNQYLNMFNNIMEIKNKFN